MSDIDGEDHQWEEIAYLSEITLQGTLSLIYCRTTRKVSGGVSGTVCKYCAYITAQVQVVWLCRTVLYLCTWYRIVDVMWMWYFADHVSKIATIQHV